MECPKCKNELEPIQDGNFVCLSLNCKIYQYPLNVVNLDDIVNNFWNNTYLIHFGIQNILFLVCADYEQQAIDEMVDYIERKNWKGLLLDDNDPYDIEIIVSGDCIIGGNHRRYLSSNNIHIEHII